MKRIVVFFLVSLVFLGRSWAQARVDRYCVVFAHQRKSFSVFPLVTQVRPWNHPELFAFKDTAIVSQLYKVERMETPSDILNYMSSIGWKLVSVVGSTPSVEYTFKREFDPTELANN